MISSYDLRWSVVCLVTMEAPGDLSAESIRNEKVKVLNAMRLDVRQEIFEPLGMIDSWITFISALSAASPVFPRRASRIFSYSS